MFRHGHPAVRHIGDVAVCDGHAGRHAYGRFGGDIGMAIKRSRGFNSDNPAPFGLWTIYHEETRRLGGAAPAEAAGVTVPAGDKWLALIQNAAPAG